MSDQFENPEDHFSRIVAPFMQSCSLINIDTALEGTISLSFVFKETYTKAKKQISYAVTDQ